MAFAFGAAIAEDMKYNGVFSLLLTICLFAGCSNAQKTELTKTSSAERKVLIVYLSRTSNTKTVAEFIREKVGGTLVALELEKPYPENYREIVAQVARQNETGFLPILITKIDKIEQYDTIFLGFPTWGMQLPPPMKSFLRQYDLKGKTVIPFNTNGGYGEGSSFQTVKELCTGCNLLERFVTKGGNERDGVKLSIKYARADEVRLAVHGWLERIKVVK